MAKTALKVKAARKPKFGVRAYTLSWPSDPHFFFFLA